jgi:hypothetical protein
MAICEFYELDFVYGEEVLVLALVWAPIMQKMSCLVLLGIGVVWGRRCI